MPTIDIKRLHSLPMTDAKKRIQRVADHITKKFDVCCAWNGDHLNFSRSGVEGQIQITAQHVHVVAELGFMFMFLKGSIEREIDGYLDKEFN